MVLEERMDDQNKSGMRNAKETWPSWVGEVSLGREGLRRKRACEGRLMGPTHSTPQQWHSSGAPDSKGRALVCGPRVSGFWHRVSMLMEMEALAALELGRTASIPSSVFFPGPEHRTSRLFKRAGS